MSPQPKTPTLPWATSTRRIDSSRWRCFAGGLQGRSLRFSAGQHLPTCGDGLTLSPGGDGDEVTGGASWRMVADMGNLGDSFRVYPGGQSDDPTDPHDDDQVRPWAEGKYLLLYFYSSPQQLQAGEVESVMVL